MRQARLEEAEIVLEFVAIRRFAQHARAVAPPAEAHARAVLARAHAQRLPRAHRPGVERRIDVDQLKALVCESRQQIEVLSQQDLVLGRYTLPFRCFRHVAQRTHAARRPGAKHPSSAKRVPEGSRLSESVCRVRTRRAYTHTRARTHARSTFIGRQQTPPREPLNAGAHWSG